MPGVQICQRGEKVTNGASECLGVTVANKRQERVMQAVYGGQQPLADRVHDLIDPPNPRVLQFFLAAGALLIPKAMPGATSRTMRTVD